MAIPDPRWCWNQAGLAQGQARLVSALEACPPPAWPAGPKPQGQLKGGSCREPQTESQSSCPLPGLGRLHPCPRSEPLQTPFLLGALQPVNHDRSLPLSFDKVLSPGSEGRPFCVQCPFRALLKSLPEAPHSTAPLGRASVPGTQPPAHTLGSRPSRLPAWERPTLWSLGAFGSLVSQSQFKCPFLTEASPLLCTPGAPTQGCSQGSQKLTQDQ